MKFEDSCYKTDWRDSSFLEVLYEYTVKNASLPSDMGTFIGYFLLFLVSWYMLVWTARFLLSLVWPVIVVVTAFFLFRLLTTFETQELVDMIFQAVTLMAETLVTIISKSLEYLLNLVK